MCARGGVRTRAGDGGRGPRAGRARPPSRQRGPRARGAPTLARRDGRIPSRRASPRVPPSLGGGAEGGARRCAGLAGAIFFPLGSASARHARPGRARRGFSSARARSLRRAPCRRAWTCGSWPCPCTRRSTRAARPRPRGAAGSCDTACSDRAGTGSRTRAGRTSARRRGETRPAATRRGAGRTSASCGGGEGRVRRRRRGRRPRRAGCGPRRAPARFWGGREANARVRWTLVGAKSEKGGRNERNAGFANPETAQVPNGCRERRQLETDRRGRSFLLRVFVYSVTVSSKRQ